MVQDDICEKGGITEGPFVSVSNELDAAGDVSGCVKDIFIGLEDSKTTWKIYVRCERMIIHEVSMPAKYENLHNYLKSKYPSCRIRLIYEAGFSGFWLHDL